jgi:hypothetical protein
VRPQLAIPLIALTSSFFWAREVVSQSLPAAQIHLGLPLPPPPPESVEAGSPAYRFIPNRSPRENARVRAAIVRKLQVWSRRLNALDLQTTQSLPGGLNALRSGSVTGQGSLAERKTLSDNVIAWTRTLSQFQLYSQCGMTDRSQDVELYNGSLGPTSAFVMAHQASTAQIQWNNNLSSIFIGPNQDAGNVSGTRWCTGTLIDDIHLLTAGHCYQPDVNGFRTPIGLGSDGNSHKLSPDELAPLTHVNFNYQIDGATRAVRPEMPYPVVKMVEFELGNLDYAILELGKDTGGELPGAKFPHASSDTTTSSLASATVLTIVQHPGGKPKRIAAGSKISTGPNSITYGDIDTADASSGAGIIDQRGSLIGVHTDPGCTTIGIGSNAGVPLAAISKVSAIIR